MTYFRTICSVNVVDGEAYGEGKEENPQIWIADGPTQILAQPAKHVDMFIFSPSLLHIDTSV